MAAPPGSTLREQPDAVLEEIVRTGFSSATGGQAGVNAETAAAELQRRGQTTPQQQASASVQQAVAGFESTLAFTTPILQQVAGLANLTPEQQAAQIFQASSTFAPQFAQLNLDLLQQFGPQFLQESLAQQQEFLPQFQQVQQEAVTREREADVADVTALSEQLQEIRALSQTPQTQEIQRLLSDQILAGLRAGTELTPEQSREVEQNVRASQIARGFGTGGGSASREAVQRSLAGLELQRQRQQQAQSFLAQEAATSADPFAAILGRPGTTSSQAQGQLGIAQVPAQQAIPTSIQAATQLFPTSVSAGLQATSQLAGQSGQFSALQLGGLQPGVTSLTGGNPFVG